MRLQRHHSEKDDRRLGSTRVCSSEPSAAVERSADAVRKPETDVECAPEAIEGAPEAIKGPSDTVSPSADAVDEPMKCVWSGYPDYNRDCRSRIPASVVIKAWHREIQLKGTVEGFYYFSWRSGVWLAYGLQDGRVRGVYCPTHCVDCDSRDMQDEVISLPAAKDPPIRRVEGSSVDGAVRAARLGAALR